MNDPAGRSPMIELIPTGPAHVPVLAGIHSICFAEPWTAEAVSAILAMPGAAGLIAVAGGSLVPGLGPDGPAGLILWRVALDEAEILTLAVLPPWRRHGLGRQLLDAALEAARRSGAMAMFLEVAATNAGALGLYESADFVRVGVRKRYYKGIDAYTMRRGLDGVGR